MTEPSSLSYRQIRVGQVTIGMVGLEELFAVFRQQGRQPDEAVVADLLAGARQHNYIPPTAQAETGQALLSEYRQSFVQGSGDGAGRAGCGTWQGRPRETIPWYPTLCDELCDSCGACLRFCSFGVYAEADDGRVLVKEPFRCQVGCSVCVRLCKQGAISFPPHTILEVLDS
jgi:NAD-dependent dihydropyrimidine dehydrogenase PreA subunit